MADEHYYNHRVRLISVRDEKIRVEFKVTPTFTEGRAVEYIPVTPLHMPGSIQVYKNTASRTFSIGAPLVSRSPNEAYENMTTLQTLRTWTLPYFGLSDGLSETERGLRTKNLPDPAVSQVQAALSTPEERARVHRERIQREGVKLLGAPPMVLYLYAHSSSRNDQRGTTSDLRVNINRVPVVITNLSISYPNDVDYLPASLSGVDGITESTESFPTKMDITVECVETHSPREYERFSLQDFYDGKLVSF